MENGKWKMENGKWKMENKVRGCKIKCVSARSKHKELIAPQIRL